MRGSRFFFSGRGSSPENYSEGDPAYSNGPNFQSFIKCTKIGVVINQTYFLLNIRYMESRPSTQMDPRITLLLNFQKGVKKCIYIILNLAAILDCYIIMLFWTSCKVYKLVVNFVDFKLQVLVDMYIFLYKHYTVERHTLNISLYYKYFIENVKDFFPFKIQV